MYTRIKFKNFKTKSKYKNESTFYNGRNYHSKLEAKVAQDIDWRIKAGEVIEVTPQKKVEFNLYENNDNEWVLTDKTKLQLKNENKNFIHITNYYLDFEVSRTDGIIELIEVKGMELSTGMMKFRLLEALYSKKPEYEIIMIK